VQRNPSYYTELECDECGAHIGWVYDFDLEGSCFACDACMAQGLAKTPSSPAD
jgi:peptide methionine sulfoxide reductase MsrB